MTNMPIPNFDQIANAVQRAVAGARDRQPNAQDGGQAASHFDDIMSKLAELPATAAASPAAPAPALQTIMPAVMPALAGIEKPVVAPGPAKDQPPVDLPVVTTRSDAADLLASLKQVETASTGQSSNVDVSESDKTRLERRKRDAPSPAQPPTATTAAAADTVIAQTMFPPAAIPAPLVRGQARETTATPASTPAKTMVSAAPVPRGSVQASQDASQNSSAEPATEPSVPIPAFIPQPDHATHSPDKRADIFPDASRPVEVKDVSLETHMLPTIASPPATQVVDALVNDLKSVSGSAAAAPAVDPQSTPQPLRVLHLTLEPPGLGQVTVHLRLTGGGLDLEVRPTERSTLHMIEADKDTLATGLTNAGYSIDKLVMNIATDQSGSATGQGNSNPGFDGGGQPDRNSPNSNQHARGGGTQPQQDSGPRRGTDGQEDRNSASLSNRDMYL